MKKTFFKKTIACLLLTLVVAAGFAIPSNAYSTQSSKLFSLFSSEGGGLQGYIDNVLAAEAGGGDSEWLFIALKGHTPSLNGDKYVAGLDSFTAANDITKETDFERIAMAYTSAGVNNDFVKSALELDLSSSTLNGIFFELILLDSGNYDSAKNSRDDLINKILSSQKSDGGWTIFGPSDVDMTAMALQALAPYKSGSNVASAIESALAFLSKKQKPDGDFVGFNNTLSSESTSQVIIALTALGIDPAKDDRFIKSDSQDETIRRNAYDGLARYQLSDGSYCHTIGGGKNYKATAQAACALAAAERFYAGKPSLYSFGKPNEPSGDQPAIVTPDEPDDGRDSSPSGEDDTESSSDDAASSLSTEASSDAPAGSDDDSGAGSSDEASSEGPSDTPANDGHTSVSGKITYKYYACGAVVILFAAACGYLAYKKKASLKNIIPLAVIAALLICGIIFINFTSVKDFYSVDLNSASDGDESVTISISCNILQGVAEDVPEDGYILKPTQYVINEGDTVFDALLAVTRANHIKINYTGSSGGLLSVYVSSIGGYAEMQYGALSGWIYRVNNYTPDVGCGSYELKDGDVIKWVYTLDLGKDAENE